MTTREARPAASSKPRRPVAHIRPTDAWWVEPLRLAAAIIFPALIVFGLLEPWLAGRVFWTVAVASLPLVFVIAGYHRWRRICPLALVAQLPASVVAKEGDRHDRIAMNFLVKQGVPAKKAYEIVSQINLQDALVPGFRVWTYYQKGQFGTWVTRGKANITPQEHAKKVLALLEDERDKALKDLADTSSERDALKTSGAEKEAALSRSAEELKAMTETAEQQRAEVQRREVEANTLRFIVGSKKALVKSKLLEKNMRKWNPATDHMSSLNLLESQEIPIDAASLGLKKVKKVTLVPEIFFAGVDYAIEVGGPTATLKITAPDKFKANRFVIVVE